MPAPGWWISPGKPRSYWVRRRRRTSSRPRLKRQLQRPSPLRQGFCHRSPFGLTRPQKMPRRGRCRRAGGGAGCCTTELAAETRERGVRRFPVSQRGGQGVGATYRRPSRGARHSSMARRTRAATGTAVAAVARADRPYPIGRSVRRRGGSRAVAEQERADSCASSCRAEAVIPVLA